LPLFQICVEVSLSQKTIATSIETESKEHLNTASLRYACKPIWEDGGFGIGLYRRKAGPWQTRLTLAEQQILNPNHTLLYDYVLLQRKDKNFLQTYNCIQGNKTNWRFLDQINELPWPYYVACDRSWMVRWGRLIDCSLYNNKHYLEEIYDDDYVFL
uniref:Peptidase S1 domain-containing protein n=1 Tax=Gongylonema pulchrum TaxID=637853 RepID=A0A183EKF1_9BILA